MIEIFHGGMQDLCDSGCKSSSPLSIVMSKLIAVFAIAPIRTKEVFRLTSVCRELQHHGLPV
jgi:hypothetical protein